MESHVKFGLTLAVLALLSSLYGNYLSREQVRIAQEANANAKQTTPPGAEQRPAEPEKTHMIRALPSILNVASAIILVVGLFFVVGSISQPFAARRKGPLQIKSAFYGTGPLNDINVTDILQRHQKDALAVLVTNELFEKDPAPNQLKRLQLEYSYGNYAVHVVTRPENSRLVLPEDPWMTEEIQRLTMALSDESGRREKAESKTKENYSLHQELVQATNRARVDQKTALNERDVALREVESLKVELAKRQNPDVPQLLVEYESKGQLEYLRLINDGRFTLKDITFGPLLWSTAYKREIHLHNVLGPLRVGQSVECRFALFEQIGNTQAISTLPGMLREIIRKGCESEPEVTISYRNMDGRAFSRRFVLAIDPFDRVAWNPGPVRHGDAQEEL